MKIKNLPNIYSSTNNNNTFEINQNIKRRNEIIDEYIKSIDKKTNDLNEVSVTSEEDDKDPFSLKNLKPIKKEKNKLILPNFAKREKLKSESSSRKKIGKEKKSNTLVSSNQTINEKKEISKNKNYSENNINGNTNPYFRKFCNNNVNDNLNSKWALSNNTYKTYINQVKYNIYLKNTHHKANKANKKEVKGRSKSHIGNKPSFSLYYDNKHYLSNNNSKSNFENRKINSPKTDLEFKNSAKNYKRNYTAKFLKNTKISIIGTNTQNKKYGKNRVYSTHSTLNTKRIIESKHDIYSKLINEKKNPYGLCWINKILGKNNEHKVGLAKGFINGVPIVKILNKGELSKKEIKKKLAEFEQKKKEEENKVNKIVNAKAKINDDDLDDEYNIPKEILEQFNKNSKNFFKVRKDIVEQPDEEEEEVTFEK